ncbi:dynein light chain, putative [Plasmodium knowlesi strain H]|uniref:Dynein light chain, putative n=3 Tax=Plasmodium knowlesi TaxID=5850 RepID=A0A1A7VCY2_PLAKH|nr:dynein light chain, putative [Plasmodium knowlesi strain H]OTN64957.1 putative Dynein light chain [Plasmodium knowlesi]CAA9988492.1 dynein light chain, putative [Plasmodium knowlesi strain H]SBO19714.1 dynein light chain, putative [Plasmodium knowlesi strain H]SBO20497.1 dynein light chain, putative [Plasmodium knowlesi strain H]VVS77966.1 dynein light chain, putative [Plasmodium knowlesi strain H]
MEKSMLKRDIINSLKTLVNKNLKDSVFNCNSKKEITDNLSNLIKDHLKSLTSNKYKIIVEILLNENREQGINVSTRLFFDKQSDFFFKESINTDTFHCLVVVYLIHV